MLRANKKPDGRRFLFANGAPSKAAEDLEVQQLLAYEARVAAQAEATAALMQQQPPSSGCPSRATPATTIGSDSILAHPDPEVAAAQRRRKHREEQSAKAALRSALLEQQIRQEQKRQAEARAAIAKEERERDRSEGRQMIEDAEEACKVAKMESTLKHLKAEEVGRQQEHAAAERKRQADEARAAQRTVEAARVGNAARAEARSRERKTAALKQQQAANAALWQEQHEATTMSSPRTHLTPRELVRLARQENEGKEARERRAYQEFAEGRDRAHALLAAEKVRRHCALIEVAQQATATGALAPTTTTTTASPRKIPTPPQGPRREAAAPAVVGGGSMFDRMAEADHHRVARSKQLRGEAAAACEPFARAPHSGRGSARASADVAQPPTASGRLGDARGREALQMGITGASPFEVLGSGDAARRAQRKEATLALQRDQVAQAEAARARQRQAREESLRWDREAEQRRADEDERLRAELAELAVSQGAPIDEGKLTRLAAAPHGNPVHRPGPTLGNVESQLSPLVTAASGANAKAPGNGKGARRI